MKASREFIQDQLFRLKTSFPSHPIEFFGLLQERIEANNFTKEELTQAVNHCIDTFEYKNLTIASVIKKTLNERTEVYVIPD